MDFNDDLSDLLGSELRPAQTTLARVPEFYKPAEHIEVCPKCRGTGRFISYTGKQLGPCFACKGAGKKTFKSSPAERAKARQQREDRTDAKRAGNLAAFKTEHPAEHAWLDAQANRGNEFAMSLLGNVVKFGSLTEGQMAAVAKNIARDAERAAERQARAEAAPAVETAGIDRLKQAFDTAIANAQAKGRGLKRPRITIGCMVISPAKQDSTNPGALYVKDGATYLGKIKDGRFFASRDCSEEQQAKVLAFIADPKTAAEAYGIETGVCCICNAQLTNKVSIERGIGPICAENFGW